MFADERNVYIYPFDQMHVQESIFVPVTNNDKARKLRINIIEAARQKNVKVTIRKRNENQGQGLRVWRVG